MNKVFLIGNLTGDPEVRTTQSGLPMARFSLAVSRRFATADGNRETDFINIVTWRATAENCGKYLKKGSKAAVVGSLQTRTYDGADGNKRYVTEVVADEVQFLSTKSADSGEAEATPKAEAGEVTKLQAVEDDLPF